MTTITYDSIEYTLYYVDSLEGAVDGDGSTVATARKDLPDTLTDYTCYLIRKIDSSEYTIYDENHVNLKRTRNAGYTHIMFLGMPNSSSELYTQLDNTVKEAWGNDTATYARVICNTPTSNPSTAADGAIFYEESIKMLYCEGCYFFRDSNNAGSSNDRFWPIFYFSTSNTTDRSFVWKDCKFSYTEYDLDNDDWLANNTTVPSNNGKCSSYIIAKSAYSVYFKNCIINYVGQYENRLGYGEEYPQYTWNRCILFWDGCKNFVMEDCKINKLNINQNSGGAQYIPVAVEVNKSGTVNKAIFRNLELNYIASTAKTSHSLFCMIYNQASDILIENIKCNIKHMANYYTNTVDFTVVSDPQYMITTEDNRNSCKINGIYLNMEDNQDIKISGLPVLTCAAAPCICYGNPSSFIKNINISFPTTVDRITSCIIFSAYTNTYIYRKDESWNTYRGDRDSSTLAGYTDGNTFATLNMLNNYLLTNINVSAPAHKSNAIFLTRVGMKTDSLNCKVCLNSATVQINTLYNNNSDTPVLTANYVSYIKCDNYIANLEKYNGIRQFNLDPRSACYITTSNVMPYDENCISSTASSAAICDQVCLNTIQNGQFFARNPMVFAKSWSSIRTGSTSLASLKVYANVYNSVIYPLCIGAFPYRGIEITPTTTGNKILTCYCARGLFNGDELEKNATKFWIDVYVPEIQEDQSIKYDVYSSFNKQFSSDSSTWSGTTAVTPFKIEIPVEIKETTIPVEVKIYYQWYSASGFVYIDPDIRLITVS